ncbi:MAG: conjugal transfer protein, partial [Candidatus Symbiopectobacterium sp. Dall1.0]|nr:conjugal transfer protein [Candidatus Symbiopectobacterium sp. Dall1.0]
MEEINRTARYKTALDTLKHPWISTPSVSAFLASCSHLKDRLPLSVAGWIPTTVECNHTALNVTLVRPEHSATT